MKEGQPGQIDLLSLIIYKNAKMCSQFLACLKVDA